MNAPSFEQKLYHDDNFYKTFNSFEHIYVYVIQFEINYIYPFSIDIAIQNKP